MLGPVISLHGVESCEPRPFALQSITNCALSVAGTAHTFSSCTSITPSGGCSMDIYASLAASGAGSVLTLGIAAVTLGGWASVGLPSTPGQMLGANAVIVWPTTGTGANVTGTKLESLEEQPVNAAMGNFAVSNAVAEYVGGKLYAVFSIALPSQSAASIAAKPTNLIYAIGPMGSAYSPGIGDHTGEWGSAGCCMDLGQHCVLCVHQNILLMVCCGYPHFADGKYPYDGIKLQVKLAADITGAAAAASPSPSPAQSVCRRYHVHHVHPIHPGGLLKCYIYDHFLTLIVTLTFASPSHLHDADTACEPRQQQHCACHSELNHWCRQLMFAGAAINQRAPGLLWLHPDFDRGKRLPRHVEF